MVINALLHEHLAASGRVDLATTAILGLDGVEQPLKLTRKGAPGPWSRSSAMKPTSPSAPMPHPTEPQQDL